MISLTQGLSGNPIGLHMDQDGNLTPVKKTTHGRDTNPYCGWHIPEENEAEWEEWKQWAATMPHLKNLEGVGARMSFWVMTDEYDL